MKTSDIKIIERPHRAYPEQAVEIAAQITRTEVFTISEKENPRYTKLVEMAKDAAIHKIYEFFYGDLDRLIWQLEMIARENPHSNPSEIKDLRAQIDSIIKPLST